MISPSVPQVALGTQATGSGTIVVDGASGSPASEADFNALVLGAMGKGELDVKAGGKVAVSGDLSVGLTGTGTLLVTGESNLSVDGTTSIGEAAGSTGNATVSDERVWVAKAINVGTVGSGTLTIQGARVSASGTVQVGGGNQQATVSVAGSDIAGGLLETPLLSIGGGGAVTVSAGGTIENQGAAPFTAVFSEGNAPASLVIDGGLYGQKTIDPFSAEPAQSDTDLLVGNNGSVAVKNAGAMTTGNADVSLGDVTVSSGGSWVSGKLKVDGAGSVTVTGGGSMLTIVPNSGHDDAVVTAGPADLTIGESGSGTLTSPRAPRSRFTGAETTTSLDPPCS